MKKFKLYFIILGSLIYLCSCQNAIKKEVKNNFDQNFETAKFYNLSVREENFIKNLNTEFNQAKTLQKINDLQSIITSKSYSHEVKYNLLIDKIEKSSIYSFGLSYPELFKPIIKNFAENKIKYELAELYLKYFFINKILIDLSKYQKISNRYEQIASKFQQMQNDINLEFYALTNSKIPRINYPPSNIFLDMPNLEDLINIALNNRFYLNSQNNPQFANSANDILEIYIPNKQEEVIALKMITIIFNTPKVIHEYYFDDLSLKRDVLKLFTAINLGTILQLQLKNYQQNIKKLNVAQQTFNNSSKDIEDFEKIKLLELKCLSAINAIKRTLRVNPFQEIPKVYKNNTKYDQFKQKLIERHVIELL